MVLFNKTMLSLLTIPTSTVTDLMANVSSFFSDFYVLIVLAISVPLAFYIIQKIVNLFVVRKDVKKYMDDKF